MQDADAKKFGPVERVADISAPWLTAALGNAGLEAEVARVSAAPIGTGQMADSFRLEVMYANDVTDRPSSFVMKMQAADGLSRQAGAGGAYESEVRFYKDLGPTLDVLAPRCFYTVGPDDKHRFALLLEDMSPAKQGDQLQGCNLEAARSAVLNLARLHGPRWCDATLKNSFWYRTPEQTKALGAAVQDSTARFVAHYEGRISKEDQAVLQAFAPQCSRWLQGRSERFAPVHGDYRLDNLLFRTTEAGAIEVTAVDWQTLDIGLPGRDLGYFLGNSLKPDDRRRFEEDLVRCYYDALLRYDVKNYAWQTCFDDYRYGQFQGLMITVLAAVGLSHTERGDDMFMAMSSRACEAIRDLDSFDLL